MTRACLLRYDARLALSEILASDQASYVTGAIVPMDDGASAVI